MIFINIDGLPLVLLFINFYKFSWTIIPSKSEFSIYIYKLINKTKLEF